MTVVISDILFLLVLILLALPLGIYICKVMMGQRVLLSRIGAPIERGIYRMLGVKDEEMTAKKYMLCVLCVSGVGFLFLVVIMLLQGVLPLNPHGFKAPNFPLIFNTAASFVSNTNWQAYAGESTLSYFTQSVGLTVQNFLSAATGIAVLFALIRGIIGRQEKTIGNFWRDLTRATLYVLLPLSLVFAVVLVSQGVVQTLLPYAQIKTLEAGVAQVIPLGPAASQVAIKQLGTNGGGFFGANSAFPLENPTQLSNILENLAIVLIPASLCVSFGKAVKDTKQGATLLSVMLVLFVGALSVVTLLEGAAVYGMEGKEAIHGTAMSALWATSTTAASNGSVNAMLDSFSPLSGMVLMFLMQLGEIVFGGVGSGLYGMLAFVLLTVFIAGLMVGRTPEYLGKKIEPYDMKMTCIIILASPILTLLGTAVAMMMPYAEHWITNTGAHGFSEILYAFSSMANNNGSAFAGFVAYSGFCNYLGGVIMLLARFVPMCAVILLAGNLAKKKCVATGEGTLKTTGVFFGGLVIFIILVVGALTFLPALSLGPVADYYTAVG